MRRKIRLGVACLNLLIGAAAWHSAGAQTPNRSGTEGSGGGIAVVCRDRSDESIREAWLLDTFEWPKSYSLKMAKVAKTGDDAIDARLLQAEYAQFLKQPLLTFPHNVALKRLLEHDLAYAKKAVEDALAKAAKSSADQPDTYVWAPLDVGMARPVRIPKGCRPEHVVFYSRESLDFDVNPEVWRALSISDRLGLLVHEVLYSARREFYGEADSAKARTHAAALTGLARAGDEEARMWDAMNEFVDYRRLILTRWSNGSDLRFRKELGGTARMRIRLVDPADPRKSLMKEEVEIRPGETPTLVRLKDKQEARYGELQITVLNDFVDAPVTIEAISKVNGEVETAGAIEGAKGEIYTLKGGWFTTKFAKSNLTRYW
jgi:hypothetical protein